MIEMRQAGFGVIVGAGFEAAYRKAQALSAK
jgi:hypothetical protein